MVEVPYIPGYRITRELGAGGMATVYEAIQESLDRPVALKVMAPSLSANRDFAGRFLKEGQTVARLNHPNIIAIYDIGATGHRHYMAMEYLGGGDLKAEIRGGMPEQQVLRILRETTSALHYAHRQGFVHRDVKPENILLHRGTGQAKLGDFGIARAVDESARMTGTGMSVGTPHYMSPEQCQGAEDIDGRSDLYSLGIVFYEMLTGSVPYDAANTVGIVMKHVQAPVPQLPSQFKKHQPLLDRLLAKDRLERFSSAGELVTAIDALTSGKAKPARTRRSSPSAQAQPRRASSTQAEPVTDAKKPVTASNSQGILWGLGGAALAMIVALSFWYLLQPAKQVGGGASLPVANTSQGIRSQGPARQTSLGSSPLEQQLARMPSGLHILTEPSNARVYVNGTYFGSGELELTKLRPGSSVSLRVEADGYEPFEQTVRVPTDQILPVMANLTGGLPRYALNVLTEPSDAQVRILNIVPKYHPGMLLEPGRYHVEVSKAGSGTATQWVEVRDRSVDIRIDLNKSFEATFAQVYEYLSPNNPNREQGITLFKQAIQQGGLSWLENSARQGNPRSQETLADYYGGVTGAADNPEAAFEWYLKAAEQGLASSQHQIGLMYSWGDGVDQDFKQAITWFRRGADQGLASAQVRLGQAYQYGRGVSQDHAEAARWFRRAAEKGDGGGQTELAIAYSRGRGVPRDDKQAVSLFRKAADQGWLNAQTWLGFMYLEGRGVAQNDAQAIAWFRKAAEQGWADAQTWMGRMFFEGRGGTQDDYQAALWFRKAAEQGWPEAQLWMGVLYHNARGVSKSETHAVTWFRKAAEQGLAEAQTWLGSMYRDGTGIRQDYQEAVKWFRRAAEQNNAWGQYELGMAYRLGNGVTKDARTSKNWLQKAADQGLDVAKKALKN